MTMTTGCSSTFATSSYILLANTVMRPLMPQISCSLPVPFHNAVLIDEAAVRIQSDELLLNRREPLQLLREHVFASQLSVQLRCQRQHTSPSVRWERTDALHGSAHISTGRAIHQLRHVFQW